MSRLAKANCEIYTLKVRNRLYVWFLEIVAQFETFSDDDRFADAEEE